MYRGASASLEVPTWEHELFLLLSCNLKSRFVGHGIDEVAFEKGLIHFESKKPGKFEEQIMSSYQQGRQFVNELLSKHSQRGTVVVDLMRREKQVTSWGFAHLYSSEKSHFSFLGLCAVFFSRPC